MLMKKLLVVSKEAESVYLDTDIILALTKKSDWLRPHVSVAKIKNPVTVSLAIVEAELVTEREMGRKDSSEILARVKENKIRIEPFTQEIIAKSAELLKKHENLNIFDSVHAAACLILKENIVSTDHIFDKIEGVIRIDPRKL